MVVETPQLVHRYQVFLRWWYPFFFGRESVVEVLGPVLGCCTEVNH